MKRIVYLLSLVLICSVTYFILPEKSYACDCTKIAPEDAFQNNDVVFEGKVIEVRSEEGVENKVLFEVKNIWKGTSSSQVIINTNEGTCTFRFAEGGEYLVFSSYRGEEKLLKTSICSGTKRLDEAKMEKQALSHIAKESIPTKKVDLKGEMVNGLSWWQVAIIFVSLLLIIAFVIFVVGRMRKK
ncbi:cobalamin biosynthesis protein CbiN [Bacillus wiedmannii]|uniref:cobalamin biosynthesis protein CbiN n=1 Tax=Bacillus wiedmannii TaxID=1890302 RepID=UPI003D9739E0